MRAFSALVVGAGLLSLAAAPRTDYQSVQQKIRAIDKQAIKPGSKVAFTSQELNAYVQAELPSVAPRGIRQPKVELVGDNVATGTALIDFLSLRSAQGKSTSWLMRKMLQGEREVAITTRIQSAAGKATVHLQRVEISGIQIDGAALDFVVDNYLLPNYPQAKIGRQFSLHKRVDRVEVSRGVAYVITR